MKLRIHCDGNRASSNPCRALAEWVLIVKGFSYHYCKLCVTAAEQRAKSDGIEYTKRRL